MKASWRRSLLPAVLVLLAGAAAAQAGRRSDVALKVDPSFFDRKIQRIAMLDVVLPSVQDDRVQKIEPMVQAALQEQGEFHLLFPEDLKAAAERSGFKAEYETLHRVWHARREIEGPALEKIAPGIQIDALVCAEVTHFEQFKIDYTSEGYSTTTVGLKIQMFDARDKKLLWEASEIKVAKSVPYNPANAVVDAGGLVKQGTNTVPNPPEYDDVCQTVVDEVIGTFPKPKAEGKEEKKKDKDKDEKNDRSKEDGGH